MKKNIHPPYHSDAKIKCVCGAVFATGSTVKEMAVEICSRCHPFYTGEKKLIDVAGRAERFKARVAKRKTAPKKTRIKKIRKK